jgi:hypothetical protein
MNVLMVA